MSGVLGPIELQERFMLTVGRPLEVLVRNGTEMDWSGGPELHRVIRFHRAGD